MTVLSDPVDQTSDGDGVSTAFAWTGRTASPSDIHCKIIGADQVVRVPEYTTSGDGNGVTVTITSGAPLVGEQVVRYRDTLLRQDVNYEAGNFPSATHERNADKLVMAAQERKTVEARSFRTRRGSPDIPELDPFTRPGAVLVSKPDGGMEEGPSADEISLAQGYAQESREWSEGSNPGGEGTFSAREYSEMASLEALSADLSAERAAIAAAADTLLFFMSDTAETATFVVASRAVISDPGPGPYPSISIEVP